MLTDPLVVEALHYALHKHACVRTRTHTHIHNTQNQSLRGAMCLSVFSFCFSREQMARI